MREDAYYMSWREAKDRFIKMNLYNHIPESAKIFGIPRGGQYVAAMSARACDTPEEADVFVDDIIDSGMTAKKWEEEYGKPVYALVNKLKNEQDAELGWIVFPWERHEPEAGPNDAVIRLLEYIGEDPSRDGLRGTPGRVIKMYKELTQGMHIDPSELLKRTFKLDESEMVVLSGIRFSSLCEHHLLPFTGEVAIGYIPNATDGRVVGISKLARLVDAYARRLQIQERMTNQIANTINECLCPQGVGVVVQAHHNCMGCRGVKQPNTLMTTSAMLGVMRDNPAARAELLSLVRK